MLTATNRGIAVSKGDTGSLTIQFSGDIPPDGTVCLVTLKRSVKAADALWEKRLVVLDGAITLRLNAEDTNYAFGEYFWDVRVFWGNDIITPQKPQPFTVVEVVGNA